MEQKLKRYELDSDYIQGICDMEENQNGEFVKFSDIEPLIEVLKFYSESSNWISGGKNKEFHNSILMCDLEPFGNAEFFAGKNAREALKKVGIE